MPYAWYKVIIITNQYSLKMMAMALSLVGEGWQERQTSQALEAQEATSTVYSSAYGM